MLKDLDETLKLLLSNNLKSDVIDQGGYRISFEPPSQEIENKGTIINLFLYDVRENVELRSSVRSWDKRMEDGISSKRVFASTRVDCSYLITVWTNRPQSNGEDSNQVPFLYEHQILGGIMQILLKYRYIPSTILQGTLKQQNLPVPIISLRSGQVQNLGEFWLVSLFIRAPDFGFLKPLCSKARFFVFEPARKICDTNEFWQAMGGKPKASIHCTVTIPVPIDGEPEEVLLVTTSNLTLETSTIVNIKQKNSSEKLV
jgi:hypothetical protein